MAKKKTKAEKIMHEWSQGELHIGKSDKTVPADRQDQAVAIMLNITGQSDKKKKKGK